MNWLADELEMGRDQIQIFMADVMAFARGIDPCRMCAKLRNADAVLADMNGTRLAALAQVIDEFAVPGTPPSQEQMALIADAFANAEEGTYYAAAAQWIDALAEYVGIMNNELQFSPAEAAEFAGKYTAPATEGDNEALAAYISRFMPALGG